jgi:hypothetical protein
VTSAETRSAFTSSDTGAAPDRRAFESDHGSDSPGFQNWTPGPVELAVAEEIDGLASEARPGLAQAALALARVMDNQRAINQHPGRRRCWSRCWRNCIWCRRVVVAAGWLWCVG